MTEVKEKADYFSYLIGEPLTAVTFVMDYLQLQFNGYLLTVLTPLIVISDHSYNLGDSGYRSALCDRITQKVKETHLEINSLRIIFEDHTVFKISLKEEDYVGAEAINFYFPEAKKMPLLVI